MASVGSPCSIFFGTCPHCDSTLLQLCDMWGPFYACEECGYEFDPRELDPKHLQPQGQPAFAAGFSPNGGNGSDGRRAPSWQAPTKALGPPLRR